MAHPRYYEMLIASVFILVAVVRNAAATAPSLVLSKNIMELTRISALMSNVSYLTNPPNPGYEFWTYYRAEPDAAIVAKAMGYCFASFRGSTPTWDDWGQNFKLGKKKVCGTDANGKSSCCSTREGFFDAYNASFRGDMEQAVRQCAENCTSLDECVVLTGHSQGGAVAAVAALALADLNPYVITFGQPPAVDAPCSKISADRWYRFVNTKTHPLSGISYDPVAFVTGLGAVHFGNLILLSEDPTGVAYMGLNVKDTYRPLDLPDAEAHYMSGPPKSTIRGYWDRVTALMANDIYPIRTTGFLDGFFCQRDRECTSGLCKIYEGSLWPRCYGNDCKKDEDCHKTTGRCHNGQCVPKLASCMPCDENSDCESDKCYLSRCTSPNSHHGKMDNNCPCLFSKDCISGRCEGFASRVCEAQVGVGVRCDENSDCLSGSCGWGFACQESKHGDSGDGSSTTTTKAIELETSEWIMPSFHYLQALHSLWLMIIVVGALVLVGGVVPVLQRRFQRFQAGYRALPESSQE